MLVGLPYMLGLFGPTEREVAQWGLVSLLLGMGLAVVWIAHITRVNAPTAWGLNGGYLLVALLQVLPVQLWWQFHGRGISDGTPPSTFVAHWAFAGPHLLLLLLSLVAVGVVIRTQRKQHHKN